MLKTSYKGLDLKMNLHVVVLFLLHYHCNAVKVNTRFPIGGIFNEESMQNSRDVFENLANMSSTKVYYGRPFNTNDQDSYSTALTLCQSTSNNQGKVAIIDARTTFGNCDSTCLISNRLNISHLLLDWEPTESIENDLFTFSYHPPPELISKAFMALIKKLQWDKFTFLYEDDGSFVRLQEVINSWPYKQDQILFRQLDPDGDNRETFKYIFKVAHMSYHVLDCDVKNIRKYMEEIIQVENSTQYQSFILTSLDAYTLNLNEVPALMANVSTMHLIKPDDIRWKDMDMNFDSRSKRLQTALTIDALNHLERAIRSMQIDVSPVKIDDPPPICFMSTNADYEAAAWPLGDKLREALHTMAKRAKGPRDVKWLPLPIKTTLVVTQMVLKIVLAKQKHEDGNSHTTHYGFTDNIEFDQFGKRINFRVHYSKLSNESQFIYVGYWDSKTDTITDLNDVHDRSTARTSKSVIRVVSRVGKPYFELGNPNDTVPYRGYAVDLTKKIFEHITKKQHQDLKYEFYRVEGDKYGNPIAGSKKWDGLIGELLEHNAEIAICDLTITSERNAVVDFSTPFMSLGISLLIKEPEPEEPDMFSFINPLSLDVWLYLATTYIIVSFILLICARMSQGDWVNPHPCNQNPENLQNIWSLYNCMWLTMGAIMTQGCDILPRAAGSRWVTGMWWFFSLIVTASYTANMSTFISNNRRSNELTDVKALSEQNSVAYGALLNGSTYKFFESSNDTVYMKLWSVMKAAKPTVFTHTNEEGRERVIKSKGKYAFFMESSAIEYYTQRHCDLKMLGGKLDSKDYGVAFPKNSPHKTLIDTAILALQESGELFDLKKKWWEEEDNPSSCDKVENEEDSGSLQMKNTSGIFLVLGVGGVLGLIVAVIDFVLHAKKISVKERVLFKEALASEWRASLDPRALHKPAAPPRSAAPSTASPSPQRGRSKSRAVSVLKAATSFINFDEIY